MARIPGGPLRMGCHRRARLPHIDFDASRPGRRPRCRHPSWPGGLTVSGSPDPRAGDPFDFDFSADSAGRAVQRLGTTREEDPDAVHAAAARGTAGGGGPLPHGESIQRAFGRHDVSDVQAHTGAAATEATRAMGAEAYATGNHVVFG